MGEKLVIGPINRGLRNDRTAFVIDNDSFPTLTNAYQWRGRVKRKRGTQLLGRLSRYVGTTDGAGNLVVTILPVPIAPGIASFVIGDDVFTDPGGASPVNLITNNGGAGPFTLNRATGVLTITGAAANTAVIYYPRLPVMGLEEFSNTTGTFPGTIAFDTDYSYNINTASPYAIYDVSFYKNPPTGLYTGYVQKTNWTPTTWNGQDYQQFWTVNYQGAMWATNGINVPFSATNVGMQYKFVTNVTIAVPPPTLVTITIANHGLVVGDFLFFNEFDPTVINGINFQTGYVVTVVDVNNVTVRFPNATITGAGGATSTGIAQYLTNRSDVTKDCLRWYDGDPTNGSATAPVFVAGNGWVNFAPPLSFLDFSVSDLPLDQYYLVGARMIVPFKDRLLFIGPVVQTSAAGSQRYLQDTIIYSQNGTPYYTASFTGDVLSAATVFNPILVPTNQTASAPTFFEDQTGFGGFVQAGVDKPIITTSINEDVLIVGFSPNLQTRLVYSGNDLIPFNFYFINSELGSSSTFSAVNLDKGVITKGPRGFIITSQVEALRIDMQIPDQVFQVRLTENGNERVTGQRDFINEWIYFSYPSPQFTSKFPSQTLMYNYRDDSWAIFNESYTAYGQFNKQTGFTWATVGDIYASWNVWNDPWNAGESELLQPEVIAGNQQGFVMVRDEGTGEGRSLYIQNISTNTITSPAHGLNNNDFIVITDALGSVSSQINGRTFSVFNVSTDTFELDPPITAATYLGGGMITRIYVPFIQTKQFPLAWDMSRKTRLGPQEYLLSTTDRSQITLLIYLSQNGANPYNKGRIVPNPASVNNSLIYSTVLYTCPESTNLGLTPANINLQMPTAAQQEQIWHRVNTSLIGDTVQVGFTLSEDQIKALEEFGSPVVITNATQANPCVLDCINTFQVGQLVEINDVEGMTELNGNVYQIIAVSGTQITIDVDTTGFTAYTDGGTAVQVAGVNAFAEIELHSIILDVQPSQLLV